VQATDRQFPAAETERMMKIQEVILKAMSGKLKWWEAAEIIAHSRKEIAIVELAANLEVPVGVIRVLAADLRDQGAITITEPPTETVSDSSDNDYAELLHKVLDGIRAL